MNKLFLFICLSCFLLLSGCSKDDNPTEPPINTELFPLAVGNKLEYNEYAIDANGNKVTGSDAKAVRTVVSKTTLNGIEAYLVVDEISKNNVVIDRDTSYINKASNGDVKYYMVIDQEVMTGLTFSLKEWFLFYKPSDGIGKEYTVFKKDTVMRVPIQGMMIDASININVTGKIIGEEQISLPAYSSVNKATRVDITMKITALGSIPVIDQLFFQQWLAEGIGPVKEKRPVISSTAGYVRELSKKYF